VNSSNTTHYRRCSSACQRREISTRAADLQRARLAAPDSPGASPPFSPPPSPTLAAAASVAPPKDTSDLPAEASALPEGETFVAALAEEPAEGEIVSDSNLIELVNKVMRKDRNNQFRYEPQQPESKLNNKTVRHCFCGRSPQLYLVTRANKWRSPHVQQKWCTSLVHAIRE
jgi:hypothetical protein